MKPFGALLSFEEAMKTAESDPLVVSGARTLELYEWEMKLASSQ